jgi:hypothetical protein
MEEPVPWYTMDFLNNPEKYLGKLDHCEGFEGPCNNVVGATWIRSKTFYKEERINWHFLCPDCTEISKKFWDDQWLDAIGL